MLISLLDIDTVMARIVGPTVGEITREIKRDVQDRIRPHTRTGSLLRSVRSWNNRYAGRVFIGTGHWRYFEYGTLAHRIVPIRKRALWWDGAYHPVKRVFHPGTRAYAPMSRAIATNRNYVIRRR